MFSVIDSEMKGLAEKGRLEKKRGRVNGQSDAQKGTFIRFSQGHESSGVV